MTNHFPHKSQFEKSKNLSPVFKTKNEETKFLSSPLKNRTFTAILPQSDFARYIKRVYSYKSLSAKEEAEITARIKSGDKEAKKILVNANLKLVFTIAKKSIHMSKIPYIDLIQEGNLGLMVAVEKFNPDLGYRFATYAGWWIKQAMFKAISEQAYCMKIPVYVQETLSKYSKIKADMERAYDCKVKTEDVAKKMNIEPEKIVSYLSAYNASLSIESSFEGKDGSEISLSELLKDENASLETSLEYERLKHDINVVISTLKEREQDVVRMRFGLENTARKTLEEIGKIFGVTKECIRQTEARALNKIRVSGLLNCYAD